MSPRAPLHPWVRETQDGSETYSRTLATSELVLSVLNEYAHGHNCPYIGATISIEHKESSILNLEGLQAGLQRAFAATRWSYPSIAATIIGNRRLTYRVEDVDGVASWANRTVIPVKSSGWLARHEQSSREAVLPTNDGDCAILYLITSPDQTEIERISKFDLLLHVHHALVDGAGMRTLLDAILNNLGNPTDTEDFDWGKEVFRLESPAIDVAALSEEVAVSLAQVPKDVNLPPFSKPDEPRFGTGIVTQTLPKVTKDGSNLLDSLKKKGRAHGVKLTSIVQAALLTVIYEEAQPTEEQEATTISGFDLRGKDFKDDWGQRNKMIGCAVGLAMMKTPVALLNGAPGASKDERFWDIAKNIQEQWVATAQRKDVAAEGELKRQHVGFFIQMTMAGVMQPPSKNLSLTFNYLSDPAGSKQLDGVYQNDEQKFTLEQYQLVTDESRPNLCCRSHSWNDQLTLVISFSYKHHTKEAIEGIMEKWAGLLESLE